MESSKVQVIESSLVVPSEATPVKGLWLSPLDLVAANRGHTPLVHLYRSDAAATASFFDDMARLMAAMAKALVAFYPLAGRLDVDKDDGRTDIRCNSEGVLFVISRANLAADDIDLKPSPELRRVFVPHLEPSSTVILAIQVTFLKCGGVMLGTAVHHAAVDGTSMFHFLQTWSAFSRDGDAAAVELPCHDRTLLRPRSPPVVHPDALSVLCPKVTFSEQRPTATEVFTISRDQVAVLKRLCGGASTFCSVSALVWRCACAARRLPPAAQVRLSFPANVRRSVLPPLPDRYFGNALVLLAATGVAREIASEAAMASVAGRVAGVIARLDDEVVRSAVDSIELVDGRPLRGSMPETELRIISWLGMPVHDVDFGWGKPRMMSRAETVRGGFVYLVNDVGSGAVRVIICMDAQHMLHFGRLLCANITTMAAKL